MNYYFAFSPNVCSLNATFKCTANTYSDLKLFSKTFEIKWFGFWNISLLKCIWFMFFVYMEFPRNKVKFFSPSIWLFLCQNLLPSFLTIHPFMLFPYFKNTLIARTWATALPKFHLKWCVYTFFQVTFTWFFCVRMNTQKLSENYLE